MNSRAKSIFLAPVLMGQALYVIARTPRLPEPAGLRTGVLGTGPDLKLLLVGDSSAAGVGADHQSEALSGQLTHALSAQFTLDWQLAAQTGMTTRNIPDFLRSTCQRSFDVAVTALGVNDITRLVSPSRWVTQTLAFHDMLRRQYGVSRIYVTEIPPIARFPSIPDPLAQVLGDHAQTLKVALQTALRDHETTQIVAPDWGLDPASMAADGFHPGPELYARWGSFMARHILHDLTAADM